MIPSYALMFAPAFLVVASLTVLNRKLQIPLGQYCIALGAGLIFAYVLVGVITAFLGLNTPLWLPAFLKLMLFLGAAALCGIIYLLVGGCCRRLSASTGWLYATLFVLAIVTFLAWGALPTQAWDSLDLWLREASRFVASQTAESSGQPYFYDQRHPFTIASLAALPVWVSAAQESPGTTLMLWFIASLSMALVGFGYAIYCQVDNKIAPLLAYAVLVTPLLENHYLLFGYADIWLAAITVAALATFGVGMRSRSKSWKILGLLLMFMLILVKNIGIVFCTALLLVVGLVCAWQKLPIRTVALSILGLCTLLIFNVDRGPPKIESVFDVTVVGDDLNISKAVCSAALFRDKFVLVIEPHDPEDLESVVSKWVASKYPGKDFRTFRRQFSSVNTTKGEGCEFKISLGEYDKKLIRIGQLSDTNHPNWMATLVPQAVQYSISALGLSVQIGDPIVLGGIGRYMALELSSLAQVGRNMLHAHFVTGSYSLWTLVLLLSTVAYCFGGRRCGLHDIFPLAATWTLLGVLLVSQIFIVDFFQTSTPGGDTRYSRFILWLPVAALIVAIPMIARAGTQRQCN